MPGGRHICYIDMPTRLVLAARSQKKEPQELYDGIAKRARHALLGDGFASLGSSDAGERRILAFDQTSMHVFLQSPEEPDHAICCICDLNGDLDGIVSRTEEIRQHIAGLL